LNANRSEVIGQSTGGAFSDIATAPKASILCTASGFVLAFNTNDATYGDNPDGWWCSGLRDHTLWTPSAATQAANGRFLDTPGAVTAAAALGEAAVAYKATSMYLGRYVGPPLIWQWTRIPGDIGCISKRAVATVDFRQYFVGKNDFYTFDGTVPQPMGAPLREWFFGDLNQPYAANIIASVDLPRSLIYWYYPSTSATTGLIDSQVVYNFRTNKWGKRRLDVSTPVVYLTGGATIDGLSVYGTYDALPSVPFDSPFWSVQNMVPAVFQGSNLYTVTGTPGATWFKTGVYGDITNFPFMRRLSPRWRTVPTSATATNYYQDTVSGTPTQDSTVSMSRNRFDFRRSARWHSFRVDMTGPAGLVALDIDMDEGTQE